MILCLGCGKIDIVGKEEDSCPICGGNIRYIPNEKARKYIQYYKTGRRIEVRF